MARVGMNRLMLALGLVEAPRELRRGRRFVRDERLLLARVELRQSLHPIALGARDGAVARALRFAFARPAATTATATASAATFATRLERRAVFARHCVRFATIGVGERERLAFDVP